MSELDLTVTRWLVQVGKGDSRYRTKYSLPTFSRAVPAYNGVSVHSGGKKRLVQVHNDGSRTVVSRELTH